MCRSIISLFKKSTNIDIKMKTVLRIAKSSRVRGSYVGQGGIRSLYKLTNILNVVIWYFKALSSTSHLVVKFPHTFNSRSEMFIRDVDTFSHLCLCWTFGTI